MRPLLAAVLSVVLCLLVSAQPAPVDTKAIDRVMLSTMKTWQIPGAAIAVVKNDRVVYVNGYGVKDLTTNEPVTADTLFQIASTSKAFTSAALAMLVDEGKLRWDDPVRQHLDYFRLPDLCADANVTIRDILSHRTGVATHDELWDGTPLTREQVVRGLGKIDLARPFRGSYQYQNIMYIAAGEVVAHASGKSWDDFVRTRIFQPLQMTRTVITDEEWSASDHATGYRFDGKANRITVQRSIDTTTIGAGGAIKSSARDMANWLRFQLANGVFAGTQLVGADALGETKTPHTPIRMENLTRDRHPESNVLSYAFGWNVQDYRGELLVSHTGSLNGFRTNLNLLPKRNSGFIVMANLGRGMALYALRNALADMLTQKPSRDWNAYYLMIDRKADEQAERARTERRAQRKPDTQPSRPLESFTGTYESDSHGTAKISLVNGALLLQWQHVTAPLEHFHYDVFTAASPYDDFEEEVAFETGKDGEVNKLTLYGRPFRRLSS
jgi:CubicO group peptidase (beta-lactamase class C family)